VARVAGGITSTGTELESSLPVIQLTTAGSLISTANDDVARLRARFAHAQCMLLPRLIEPGLLRTIQRRIDESAFVPFVSDGIGDDLNLADPLTINLLFLLTNDPPFLQIMREVTGCIEIDSYQGRVYRMYPDLRHTDSWHDDMSENRMVGMSLNLSTTAFEGAAFQLRDRTSNQILYEVANTGSGDAIIFRLAGHLQHRNTELTGSVQKTAFAGWFRSHQPAYYSQIRSRRSATTL